MANVFNINIKNNTHFCKVKVKRKYTVNINCFNRYVSIGFDILNSASIIQLTIYIACGFFHV